MSGSFGTIVRRDIRATLGRFLAIVGIVALGCGFLAGLTMGGPDMRAAADRYDDGTHLWDLRLVSTLGFSDDDARRVAAIDGVDAVMPSIATDAMARIGGRQQAVRVSLLPEAAARSHADGDAAVSSDDGDYLNRLILRDGRWPRAADEAVALADAHDDVRLGGTARIGSVAEGGDTTIGGRRFTIVGTVSSPDYPYTVSFGTTSLGSGQLDQVLYVPRDAFGDTPYTELYLTVDGAAAERDGSDGYRNVVDAVADRIRDHAPDLATARRDDLRAQAMAQVEAMRDQLERTEQQLAAAQAARQPPSPQDAQSLQAARDQAAQAQSRIDEATRQAESIARPDIAVLDRTASESHATYRADSERMDSIARVFPVMFFLVAALVALTTMTRMVETDRTQIGVYKALGYGTGRIAGIYLTYAALASVLGAVVGIAALCQLLPAVVMNAYAIIYAVPHPPFPLPVSPAVALTAGGVGVAVTLGATWAAVAATVRERPAALMTPRAPKAGRRILLERIGPLWRRMSFSWKVSARNILRYRRRFLMTVIGVSGCTALMLVGFGLHDAIWDIIDIQFGQIQRHDMTVSTVRDLDAPSAARVRRTLVDDGARDLTRVDVRAMLAEGADGAGSDDLAVQVVVARDPARLARSIDFRERVGHRPVAFGADSALVTEKAARTLGVAAGDDLSLSRQNAMGDATGAARRVPVTGVVENYVGNVVYLGPDAWARLAQGADGWDTNLSYGTWYATAPAGDAARDRLADALRADHDVTTVGYVQTTIDTYGTMLSAIDVIVAVLIVSAAALAFIVLYDLTTIDIGERIREIATLKVLGFRRGEVDAYVFREVAVLVVIGALAGLGLGTWLEGFVITTVEVDVVMFGRTIHAASYLWAFLLTGLFSAVVMLAMRPRLAAIDMVESLKSVD